jgi:dephospho-CoA kinase
VETFREAFGEDFTLVHVYAPYDVRRERIESRDRPGDTDGESLESREEREKGFGMDDAIELADRRIDNTGTLDEFHETFRALLEGEDD